MDGLFLLVLQRAYPIFLISLLFLILIFSFFCRKILFDFMSVIKLRTWIVLFLVLLISLFIRSNIFSQEHLVLYDEFEHMNIAENFHVSGKLAICLDGNSKECDEYKEMNWPSGFHVLLSWAYAIFGINESIAFLFNLIFGINSIILIFLLVFLISGRQEIGLLSSVILMLSGLHSKLSMTTSLEMVSFFFILLSVFLFELFLKFDATLVYKIHKKRNTISDFLDRNKLFLFFLFSLVYAVNCRSENILLIPLFGIYYFFSGIRSDRKKFKPDLLLRIMVFLIISLTFLFFARSFFLGGEGWIVPVDVLFNNFILHSFRNFIFLISDFNYSLIVLCAAFGVLVSFSSRDIFENKVHKARIIFFILFFCLFFFFISAYHIGSFLGINSRYALVLFIPLICLSLDYFEVSIRKLGSYSLLVAFLIFPMFFISGMGILSMNHHLLDSYDLILRNNDILSESYVLNINPQIIQSTISARSTSPDSFIRKGDFIPELFYLKDNFIDDRKESTIDSENELMRLYFFEPVDSIGKTTLYHLRRKANS